jgi:hypothetical protein
MTIATRNRFIRIAACAALALAVTAIVCIVLILVRKHLPATMLGVRPLSFMHYSPYASLASIGLFPIVSLAGLLYILFAFEKTQTIEITFFAACLFSLSIEAFRLFIPLYQTWLSSGFLAITISRAILVARIFLLLSLLCSGIFTTGQTSQEVGPSIFLLAFFSFALSKAIPFNEGHFSSNFLIQPSYTDMVTLFMLLIGVLCVLVYLIPGKLKTIPEYRQAAGGLAMFLAGYAILSICDSWVFFAAGSILFVAGTCVYLDRLHRYYLWQ